MLLDIPHEIFQVCVLTQLDLPSLVQLSKTCTRMHHTAHDYAEYQSKIIVKVVGIEPEPKIRPGYTVIYAYYWSIVRACQKLVRMPYDYNDILNNHTFAVSLFEKVYKIRANPNMGRVKVILNLINTIDTFICVIATNIKLHGKILTFLLTYITSPILKWDRKRQHRCLLKHIQTLMICYHNNSMTHHQFPLFLKVLSVPATDINIKYIKIKFLERVLRSVEVQCSVLSKVREASEIFRAICQHNLPLAKELWHNEVYSRTLKRMTLLLLKNPCFDDNWKEVDKVTRNMHLDCLEYSHLCNIFEYLDHSPKSNVSKYLEVMWQIFI